MMITLLWFDFFFFFFFLQLMQQLRQEKDFSMRLKQYVDRIIITILEKNPSLLEIKGMNPWSHGWMIPAIAAAAAATRPGLPRRVPVCWRRRENQPASPALLPYLDEASVRAWADKKKKVGRETIFAASRLLVNVSDPSDSGSVCCYWSVYGGVVALAPAKLHTYVSTIRMWTPCDFMSDRVGLGLFCVFFCVF